MSTALESSSFIPVFQTRKIDIDGDGKLTKREMLAGNEFTIEEVFDNFLKLSNCS